MKLLKISILRFIFELFNFHTLVFSKKRSFLGGDDVNNGDSLVWCEAIVATSVDLLLEMKSGGLEKVAIRFPY